MLIKVHVCKVVDFMNSRYPALCPPVFKVCMSLINVLMHKFRKKRGSYVPENARYPLFVYLRSWRFYLFLPPFFEKSGHSLVSWCVRKIVPAFANVCECGPEENLRYKGVVKKVFTKNHQIRHLEESIKSCILAPKTPLFHPYQARPHSQY